MNNQQKEIIKKSIKLIDNRLSHLNKDKEIFSSKLKEVDDAIKICEIDKRDLEVDLK